MTDWGRCRFACGAVSLELRVAAELDALVSAAADPDRLPYWAVLWESAPALACWLVRRGGLAGVPVLELGCGAGLVGLAAAVTGAGVVQTDRFPEAVALARENAQRNRITGIRQVAADWRAWPLRGKWPLVVGSDVLYERGCHAPLLEVLERSTAPGGEALLADPLRPMSLNFFVRAEAAGWHVEFEELPRGEAEPEIILWRLRRGETQT